MTVLFLPGGLEGSEILAKAMEFSFKVGAFLNYIDSRAKQDVFVSLCQIF
jgi:hypothetical protein